MIKIQFYLSNLKGGGAQRTVVNILRHIDRDKFKPKLILFDYDENMAYSDIIPEDIEIINLNTRGRYSVLKISKLIKNEDPDIVFGTLPQVNIALTLGKIISRNECKMILRETNYRKKGFNSSYFSGIKRKFTYSMSDKVVALSKGVANQIIEECKLGKSKVTIIYNPVDI